MITQFNVLRWKNILSTGNQFTEIDLSTNGNTLIVGENGSGKSTFLDALTFALFGKPFRNINKPQLINSINGKEALVEVEFSIGRSNYKIIRGMKPAVFEVYCNGVMLNQSSETRDYQEILEKQILKTNFKTFCQVDILGSASYVPFMQLPASQRRSIIEDLLDLEIFTTMNVLLKDKIQQNNEDTRNNLNDQKLVKEKIVLVKEHLDEILAKNKESILAKEQTIFNLQIKMTLDVEKEIELSEIVENIKLQKEDTKAIGDKIGKLTGIKMQMNSKLFALEREIEFFNHSANCPTCQQNIDEQFRRNTLVFKGKEINELKDGLIKLEEIYKKTDKKLEKSRSIDKQILEQTNDLDYIRRWIENFNRQIQDLVKEVEASKNSSSEASSIKIVDLDNELLILGEQYNALQENKKVLSVAASLLKDGGIKTKIINQYIPVINKLLSKYLSEFDLFVEFNLDEQFNETIKSRYRDNFSYESFSEGEKSRIDLAILFTWRAVAKMRNSLNTNLLILDEVFDSSLDTNASDDLLRILQNVSKDSNVLVISHRDGLHDKFTNVLKFVKTKNFSRIE